MAPSLPGTSGRRAAARGASSSSPSTVKRETRPSRSGKKNDSDSEDQTEDSSSGSKRPVRKASSRSRTRVVDQEIEPRDDDESDNDEEEEDAADEQAESEGPAEDLEEIEGEIDETGETKITKDGELLGGRQYKCRSFKLPDRGDRIYMLSMDPARVLGFRDSYLFFLRNPQLVRVNTTVEERQWMIENGMLMANFKSKLIAVVTARSIFKSFGARIIKNGRSRVDDYYESNPTEEDAVDESEGDAASRMGDDNSGANGNGTQHEGTFGSAKRKLMHDESTRHITDLNWQYESAMAVRALNSRLKELRKENPKFLDPHTNIEQVPLLLQPTRCQVKATSVGLDNQAPAANLVSIPRSIGPQAETAVKIEINPGAPLPPLIHDPNIWAAIPEDICRILEEAEAARAAEEDDNEDLTKYPISILSGQYQAAYPIHQARFQQPYRMVLPQSMGHHAQYIHHLWSTQFRHDGPLTERITTPGGDPTPQGLSATSHQGQQPQPPQPQLNNQQPQVPQQQIQQQMQQQIQQQQQQPQFHQQRPPHPQHHPQQPIQYQPQLQQAVPNQYSRRR